ncbi:MAG: 4-(cytidine 5'-diphospho)-2-C-methyl-D-erythritol kinase [Nitrospirae bacterium]|nr:4-(cytidine 5'-diphospho)-2-C-methyl-D-erythritol kinase [Nitrospirota bacterium]
MFTLSAPAKINWLLGIKGKRDDGFHEICSIVQKISLYDKLSFSKANNLILKADCGIPAEDNLVYKAALLLKGRYKVDKGALIELDKRIPAGAGLGGGSSDAASTLAGLNRLWSLGLSLNELSDLAGELGSDVPFFLYDSICYIYGRGEKVVPFRASVPANLVIVKPDFDVSTSWAYNEFSNCLTGISVGAGRARHCPDLTKKWDKEDNIRHFIRKIGKAEVSDIAGGLFNDLEAVTVKKYPVIADIKKKLLENGALASLMSGSGSAVFGVFDSMELAEDAVKLFKGYWAEAVRTITD